MHARRNRTLASHPDQPRRHPLRSAANDETSQTALPCRPRSKPQDHRHDHPQRHRQSRCRRHRLRHRNAPAHQTKRPRQDPQRKRDLHPRTPTPEWKSEHRRPLEPPRPPLPSPRTHGHRLRRSDRPKRTDRKRRRMLILVWCDSIEKDVLEAAKQHECAIILSGHGSMNTSRYLYFSLPVSALMSTKLITFERSEYVEDVIRKMSRYRYRSYPIVFEEQLCGYLEAGKMLYPPTKNMILVDHNEFSQSVKNIEKASVLEVIDHHRIHDFTSTRPVYFRNETVGSTCTIVTSLFFEHNIPIPRQLAGLLLGAMISDTLNFQSPTTTQKDIDLAQRLANLAHETIDELAYDIFFSNDLSQKDINDFLQEDMKHFEITNYQVAIAQSIIPQSSLLSIQEQELKEKMEAYTKRSGIDLYVFALTSILENGTYFYISGPLAQQLQQNLDQTHFFPNILSRKKQIVPLITNWIQEAN